MAVFLRPDVHAAVIGQDLVLLDEAADRYLCWPSFTARLDCERRQISADPDLEAEILLSGLGCPDPSEPAPLLPPPARDLFRPAEGPIDLRDLKDLVRAALDIPLTYRGRPFSALLEQARRRPPAANPDEAPSPALVAVVGRFHRWAPWIPAPAKCLLRSHLLLRHLRRAGHDARWVFAVRTWPFGAHCWLQCADVALDDHHERLAAFHPILVV